MKYKVMYTAGAKKIKISDDTTSSLSITGDIERASPFKVLALSKIPF